MKKRAGVVIYCQDEYKILLLFRRKNSEEYWVVPGGGLFNSESFENAARREIKEELNIDISNVSELCHLVFADRIEKYYICQLPHTIACQIHGEEMNRSNENNIYSPEWVDISSLELINLLPSELKNVLINHFQI